MPGQYAKETDVPVDRSIADIRRTLRRYGATNFVFAEPDEHTALISFAMHDRQVRFLLTLPEPDGDEFTKTPTGLDRKPSAAQTEYDKAVRRVYRVFYIAALAMLEMVASGVAVFEELFLPFVVLPGGKTVAEEARPAVARMYATGQVQPLLPNFGRREIEKGS
jgi:hypothetical protein